MPKRQINHGKRGDSKPLLLICSLVLIFLWTNTAYTQTSDSEDVPESNEHSIHELMEEITVTARKRGEEADIAVPIAISAFGDAQLRSLNFKNLSSLTYYMPNVSLDQNGSNVGFQNFSIRGLGINSSSPSIDPTVGVFQDGVYIATNVGILSDQFDLHDVQVLRGPQGILFGRNVTGGAVLLNTKDPTDYFTTGGRFSYEVSPDGGSQATAAFSISGPLVQDTLSGKVAIYYTDDQGWFENQFDGSDQGAYDQFVIRPSLRWTPTDNVELLLKFEFNRGDGQGAVSQNRAVSGIETFDVNINNKGFFENDVDFLVAELNWDVGGGTLTNIFGWRDVYNNGGSDIDGLPSSGFDITALTDQDQISNELRYFKNFGNFDLTTGIYYLSSDLTYIEGRSIAGGAVVTGGGGVQDTTNLGLFASLDWQATETVSFNAGLRATREKKDVQVSAIRPGGGSPEDGTLNFDFSDKADWSDWSPRLGVTYRPSDNTNIYATYSGGFRSGGYNFRSTVPGVAPGPFDSEQQTAYEIGLKQAFLDGRGRINVAVFSNEVQDIQREVQVPLAGVGIANIITNAGDVDIEGVELDGQFAVSDNFLIGGFFGYTNTQYTKIDFDLTADGTIDSDDFALDLPRAPRYTYGMHIVLDAVLGDFGQSSARLNWSHRDSAFNTDDNRGVYWEVDMVDFNFIVTPNAWDQRFSFSLYGRNLLNEANNVNDAIFPDIGLFGGDGPAGPRPLPTFTAIGKGRVIGAEVRYEY